MPRQDSLNSFSRRGILAVAGAALLPWNVLEATLYSDFWNKKEPSKWSQDEIDKLLTKSPWAREVTASYAPGERPNNGGQGGGQGGGQQGGGYPGGYPGGGMPRIGIGGRNRGGMGGGRGRGQGQESNLSTYKGTVRWESAQPILDALKTPLPDAFANHYVISVVDFPLLTQNRRQSQDDDAASVGTTPPDDKKTMDDLKQATTLQPKDKDRVEPDIVQRQSGSGSVFLFGFARSSFDFGKNDHEVDFHTHLGRLVIRAKFDPRDMTYHKKLAV
jgi:hypothetical protein